MYTQNVMAIHSVDVFFSLKQSGGQTDRLALPSFSTCNERQEDSVVNQIKFIFFQITNWRFSV